MTFYLVVREDENSKRLAQYIQTKIKGDYTAVKPDVVIAVGGDGTILEAFHLYPKSVLLGLHTGHLGFLANYSMDTIDELILDVNEGAYKVKEIPLLSCEIVDESGKIFKNNALNEITIVSPMKTLIVDISIDDEYLETFRGTGVCVSTTLGSTGYNKSLYGAVVDHDLVSMQITEMASINSNSYRTLGSPLLLCSKRRITLSSSHPLELSLTVDHLSYNLKNFQQVSIFYGGVIMKMGEHHSESFIKRIGRTFIDSKK